jgi:PadR family transcriptional regulator, regulatory protein PadR
MQDRDDGRDRRIIQLRKGILELAVMGVLFRGRHYGYSLVRVLSEHGGSSLKEGTVYPILARLDRDGLVRSEWVESAQGPPRKYYALTPAGRRLFTDLSQELDLLVALVKQQWEPSKAPDDTEKKLFVQRR